MINESIIICDTREKLHLPFPKYIKRKLDVGDYSTTLLENHFHIERKSGIDMANTLIHGHERFKRECIRASENGIVLHVMIECSESDFIQKRFPSADRIKTKGETLHKILSTMSDRYNFTVEFCGDRESMMQKMQRHFYLRELNLDSQKHLNTCSAK